MTTDPTPTPLRAFHNDAALKEATLAELREHRRLDQIVQGFYWEDSKGCAVGCMTHDPDGGHRLYPEKWGIPVELAYLEDRLFECLTVNDAKEWPLRFIGSIPVGADLTLVWSQWCVWMLRHLCRCEDVAVEAVAALYERHITGDELSPEQWQEAWTWTWAWAWGWAWLPTSASASADELIRLVELAPCAG